MNTRRYPRTQDEAFGPYGRSGPIIDPEERDYSATWWFAITCCAIAAAIVIAITNGAPS
jgi:hypothetical protein